jgi:hypothetical protein
LGSDCAFQNQRVRQETDPQSENHYTFIPIPSPTLISDIENLKIELANHKI